MPETEKKREWVIWITYPATVYISPITGRILVTEQHMLIAADSVAKERKDFEIPSSWLAL